MTATGAPVQQRPLPPARASRVLSGRLLRLELRYSVMLLIAPLAIALLWFDAYRAAMTAPPVWPLRGLIMQLHSMEDLAPFVVGASAWAGSRDGRRRISDLVFVTARPQWASKFINWGATACWSLVIYLGLAAIVYIVTSHHATWGGPLWWPVAVGAVSLIALSAVGFAAGALFSSRFTAPLAAVAVFVLVFMAVRAPGNSPYALVSPANDVIALNASADIGIFNPYADDMSIAEFIFMAGLAAAALGALGLPAAAGSQRARRAAAVFTAAGVVVAGTALALAGTAQMNTYGMMTISALHDGASDNATPYTPVCDNSAVPICVHPAFRSFLPEVTSAIGPLLSEVSGLPGAPVRVIQVATTYHLNSANYRVPDAASISGNPPVLDLPLGSYLGYASSGLAANIQSSIAPGIAANIVGAGSAPGTVVQQAIEAGLLQAGGVPLASLEFDGVQVPASGSPVYKAAVRFAALSAAARHSWLVANLAEVRAGHLTLERVP